MPAGDGVRVDDHQCVRPAGPNLSEQDPEQPVQPMQAGAHPLPLEHGNLLAKREHFEGGITATANENAEGGEECEDKRHHESTVLPRRRCGDALIASC